MGKQLPSFIKNIRQLIHWHYAKIISESIIGSRDNYAFVMNEFKKLESSEKNMSSILRNNKQFLEMEKKCAYCDSLENIQLDHIIPLSRGGPDSIDNLVYACKKCNLSKGIKSLPEWFGDDYSNKIPKFVFAKFLKVIYDEHKKSGTLESSDLNGDGLLDYRDLLYVFTCNEV